MSRSYGTMNQQTTEPESVQPSKWHQNVSFILGLVLLIIFAAIGVSLIISTNKERDALSQTYQENADTIAELTESLNQLRQGETLTAEEVQAKMYTAATYGQEIANAQSLCMHMDLNSGDIDELSTYKTKIMQPVTQYVNANDSSDRDTWFKYNIPQELNWEFNSTYQYAGTSIPVLWTLYDEDGKNLLAYTTGVFDATDGVEIFSNVKVHITKIGRQVISVYEPIETGDASESDAESATTEEERTSLVDDTYQFEEPTEETSEDVVSTEETVTSESESE